MAGLNPGLGGLRQSSMLGGLPKVGGVRGALIQTAVVSSTLAATIVVPNGATVAEIFALGSSGGSGGMGSSAYTGGPGGGGAIGHSLITGLSAGGSFSVAAMSAGTSGISSTTAATSGSPTTVSYGGSVVAQGDGGSAGATGTAGLPIGAAGAGGLAQNCVGNIEVRGGLPGVQNGTTSNYGANNGGAAPPSPSTGVPFVQSGPGVNSSGTTGVNGSSASGYGAGPSGPSGPQNTARNGAAGELGIVMIYFYAS